MNYRKLGHTDIDVSVITLGCWPFAGDRFWGKQDDQESIATVHAALDSGVNFFDTAEGYGTEGRSERVLGEALYGRRDRAVIATKVSQKNLTAAKVASSCEGSLRRLRTDYIDLYQIHWPNWDIPIEETYGALDKLKQSGKIRVIGVSNFGVKDLSDLLEIGRCETNQLPYSLFWRAIEHEIKPRCEENEVGILCYSPLAQGLLTGRYTSVDGVPEHLTWTRWYTSGRGHATHGESGCEKELFAAIDGIRGIAEGLSLTPATIALAWLLYKDVVTSVLVGARNAGELMQNLPAAETRLSPETISSLQAAADPIKDRLGSNPDMWMSESRYR